jgi:hypothetical protein
MNTRFIHFMLVAALVALLPTSASAFTRYGGGGGGMHYGGGGGMHSMPQGYPMQGHGMPSGGYSPRVYGGPPRGEIMVRHGPPIEHFGGMVRGHRFGGGGVVIERGGYGSRSYGGSGYQTYGSVGGYTARGGVVLGGAYGYSRWLHHDSGREYIAEQPRPAIVSRGGNCCCDTGDGVVDSPIVVERPLTQHDVDFLRSVYKDKD